METYHILNGDCLIDQLAETKINQDFIVCRECLIDGNLKANTLANFWEVRANFIAETYHTTQETYFNKTVKEFEKIKQLPNHADVCLWFENDLFCQTNMWFVIWLIAKQPLLNIFRVFPIIKSHKDIWKGFGIAKKEDLENAYQAKVKFTAEDLALGKNLWKAYQEHDLEALKILSKTPSNCFKYLEEVCAAHIDRFPPDHSLGRPDKVVKELLITKLTSFEEVFIAFNEREGIYGFGDSQLMSIFKRQINPK
ncbi:DUF1835 domain-containing protein [Pedobacter cryophilus]|uniref:DUF1835 domain-containing protein n=1 Tax=Pedobacter cryophilus TaxID=2571271 RepID=A0A4U1BT76_9SPHI|nr:DUF1835 domain-containing protein [Pedobacter cryophilus]TKB95559.1 DUF1835 domain-containing protein [Pedobacter cryophilus]